MATSLFDFQVKKRGPQSSRLGRLTTPHGIVETPAFIFCATKAAMKSLTAEQLKECDTQIILSNTYHLMLQPGSEIIKNFGGLQKFTGWRGPMLTDSGGFQIFSLGHGTVADEIKGRRAPGREKYLLKISEEGACFRSYINGKKYFLTPEESIRVQHNLGADLIVVLDECTPFHVDKSYTKSSMERSHRWALRSLEAHLKGSEGSGGSEGSDRLHELQGSSSSNCMQQLYGIVQGGIYPDLRKESCKFVNDNGFFGHAVGGSLGANKQEMYDVVSLTMDALSKDRPVHLLGIGGIRDIFHGVMQGVDTFDCVNPTRIARRGGALVKPWHLPHGLNREHINLRNSQYRLCDSPIEIDCVCLTCKNYTRGYLHHLLNTEEILAFTLVAQHNAYFMNALMRQIREALDAGNFDKLYNRWMDKDDWVERRIDRKVVRHDESNTHYFEDSSCIF